MAQGTPPASARAFAANTFLNSLGVNTFIDQGANASQYTAPLQYTGIRNIRDAERNLPATIMLHQQTGVMVNLGAGCDVPGQIAAAKRLAAIGALLSLEGPNEPGNFPITYNGRTGGGRDSWLPVAQCQRDLYSQAKQAVGDYPVFSVSEHGAEQDNVGLQFLTIPSNSSAVMPAGTQYADYANTHNYVDRNGYIDNAPWQNADPSSGGPWDGMPQEYGVTWLKGYLGYARPRHGSFDYTPLQSIPRVTTETGWDSVHDPGGETVQGKVLVNTYLSQFKRVWKYTFIYKLMDGQGSSDNMGIYHSDTTPKTAATYIHNLTTILADKIDFAPGFLSYSIPDEPATVHDLLLQKRTGQFELVIWGEAVSAMHRMSVVFGERHGTVNVYDVTVGTSPTNRLSNVDSVDLTLADHALVIEVLN